MSDAIVKPKSAVKMNHDKLTSKMMRAPSRPGSPVKPSSTGAGSGSSSMLEPNFRPKAKINSSATTRKTSTANGAAVSKFSRSRAAASASTTPRAASPTKNPRVKGTILTANSPNIVSRTLTASPYSQAISAPVTPELRRTTHSRTPSGSAAVQLNRATSISSFHQPIFAPSPSSVVSAGASGSVLGLNTASASVLSSGSGLISATASPRLMSSRSIVNLQLSGDRSQTSSPTLRIRSKVSNLAMSASNDPASSQSPSPTSPPLFPSTRIANISNGSNAHVNANPHSRVPSTSSAISHFSQPQQQPTSPPPQFYPITTAVPAANPHRFAQNTRPASSIGYSSSSRTTSPPATHHVFQSFGGSGSQAISPTPSIGDVSPLPASRSRMGSYPNSANEHTNAGVFPSPSFTGMGTLLESSPTKNTGTSTTTITGAGTQRRISSISVTAKVDPASIPLPPNSPPISTLSSSSRSRSSASIYTPFSASANASDFSPSTDTDTDTDRESGLGLHPNIYKNNNTSMISRNTTVVPSSPFQEGSAEHLRDTLDSLMLYTSGIGSAGVDEELGEGGRSGVGIDEANEHKVKATAKSNRKIADLEITNRSLLAINASLESTKHRQAGEIRDLRRKLRESRLILPPRIYKAVRTKEGDEGELEDEEEEDDDNDDEDDGDDENEDEKERRERDSEAKPDEKERKKKTPADETYKRIKLILDNLLRTGREALALEMPDILGLGASTSSMSAAGGAVVAKVLSPEEQRDWAKAGEGEDGDGDGENNGYHDEELEHGYEDHYQDLDRGQEDQENSGYVTAQDTTEYTTTSADTTGSSSISISLSSSLSPSSSVLTSSSDSDSQLYSSFSLSKLDINDIVEDQRDEDNAVVNNEDSMVAPGNDSMTSEEEVEAMTIIRGIATRSSASPTPPSSPPPPIFITQSS